jgi:FAD/FMN-containing dehydrogenase
VADTDAPQRAVAVSALDDALAGRVVAPGEDGWDEARAAWNLIADQRPVAVAQVESADDVSAAIGFARSNGLGIAPQGTGHGAACRGSIENTILIRTERMNGIEIDAEGRTGRFEAGVIWRDAGNAAAEHEPPPVV